MLRGRLRLGREPATGTSTPNTRRPLKDGYYDHAQNCLEYIVLAFGPTAERKPKRVMYPPLPVYRGRGSWMARRTSAGRRESWKTGGRDGYVWDAKRHDAQDLFKHVSPLTDVYDDR